MALLEQQLRETKRTRLFLVCKGDLNKDWLKLVGMIGLFMSAEEHGLKPLKKVGRGNKNPVKEFVSIITGIQDREKIDRYYKQYKSWVNNKLSLI